MKAKNKKPTRKDTAAALVAEALARGERLTIHGSYYGRAASIVVGPTAVGSVCFLVETSVGKEHTRHVTVSTLDAGRYVAEVATIPQVRAALKHAEKAGSP